MDINEATDMFETNLVELVNNANIPMVNIELVITKVLSAVREVKFRTIEASKEASKETVDAIMDGTYEEGNNNEGSK